MAGGQGFTSTAGSIASLVVTVVLSGAAITSGQGSVSPNNEGIVPLTGLSSSVSSGTVTHGWGQAITGSEITANRGTLTLTLRPTDPVGQAIASSAGNVTASGTGASAHLSGQEITSSQGDVGSGYQFITGIASTPAQTAPGIDLSMPISGQAVSCSSGAVSPNQDAVDSLIESFIGNTTPSMAVALSGAGLTGAQGSVTVTGDSFIALTGSESTGQTGTITHEEAYPIAGQSISSAQYPVGAPGGASLTGAEASVVAGNVFTDNDRTFAITGVSTTSEAGITFASSLGFAIGQQLNASLQGIGPRRASLIGSAVSTSQGNVSPPVVETGDATGGWPAPPRKKKKPEKREIHKQPVDQASVIVAAQKAEAEKVEKELRAQIEKLVEQDAIKRQLIEEELTRRLDELEEETIMLLVSTKTGR